MILKRLLIGILAWISGTLAVSVAPAADAESLLAKPEKLLFEDDFSRSEMAPKWTTGKGSYLIEGGVAKLVEDRSADHGPAMKAAPRFPFKDIVAEFSIKPEASKVCHIEMRDKDYKGSHVGHIATVSVTPASLKLSDYKLGVMKNEYYEKLGDKNLTQDGKQKIKDSLKAFAPEFPIKLDPTRWHQVRIELVGDEMLVSIDGKPAGYLKSEGISHPTKETFGFSTRGKATLLDNVKVWEAVPSPTWPARRAAVLATLPKP